MNATAPDPSREPADERWVAPWPVLTDFAERLRAVQQAAPAIAPYRQVID
jgi:hypothetical protein